MAPYALSKGQDERVADVDTVVFSSSEVSVEQNNLNSSNGEDTDSDCSSDSNSCLAVESSINSSLQEKVAKFIQNGELDEIEGTLTNICFAYANQ